MNGQKIKTTVKVPLKVLLIGDSEDDGAFIRNYLETSGYDLSFTRVVSEVELRDELGNSADFDIILCDLNLPGFTPSDALNTVEMSGQDIPFIVVSGYLGEFTAVDMMSQGARDFVSKSCLARLLPVIKRELGERSEKKEAEESLAFATEKLGHALQDLDNRNAHLLRTERMRSMGQMASGIAHDFNNILLKISGYAAELSDEFTSPSHPLSKLQKVVEDASGTVARLRDFYRPISDSRSLSPVDLQKVVKESFDLSSPIWKTDAEATGCRIEVVSDVGDCPMVKGYASEIREALTNLIINSVHAMPKGGTITASAKVTEGRVTLSLSDTGSGMDPETLERCTEPFFSTKGEGGSGLGLGIVSAMMKSFGGEIEIESQEAVGTTIALTFRVHQKEGLEKKATANSSSTKVSGLRVLVAEDDPAVAEVISRFLWMGGHSSCIAADGEEALSKLKEEPFDAIISDRAMPRMGGDELAEKAKEMLPERPFIMATAFVNLLEQSNKTSACIDSVLRKPFTKESLLQTLNECFLPAMAC